MLINRGAIDAYLRRPLDDFSWLKQLAREAVEGELAGLRVRPRFKTEPWLHQLVCFYIAMCEPRFMFLLDMGTGKTKIILDVLLQLMREGRATRGLVTVPRLINIDSWKDDAAKHSELEPNLVRVEDIEAKRELLLNPPASADFTVIDYQGLHWALCKRQRGTKGKLVRDDKLVRRAQRLYDFVGVDEIHKLANRDSLWWGIMRQLTKEARSVYGATGTLFGKNPEMAFGQFKLVDGGETLGENIGIFRAALFDEKPGKWKAAEYTFPARNEPTLTRILRHRSIRYDESEVQDLPKLQPVRRTVDMGAEQREHYMRALEGLINANGELSKLEAQWLRMRQIVSGYLAWKDDTGNHVLRFKHNPKLDALESIVDEMGDSKCVVCYDYTETGRMISERLTAAGIDHVWYWGGTKDQSATRRRFLDDPACRIMVMNSEAGGTGNDGLQNVARYMVFYETPTPPITRKQTVKRIHRSGQKRRSYVIDLVAERSLDGGILDDLAASIDTYDRVVNGRGKGRNFFLS
ncbi:hypothetical protein D3C71_222000 [compost metagenome]